MKNKISQILSLIFVLVLCLIFSSACGEDKASGGSGETAAASSSDDSDEEASISFEAMDTYMTITVYGSNAEEAAYAAQEEIERLDGILSAEEEGCEIYEINSAGGGTLSDDAAYLLEASINLWQITDGAFDITIYPIAELWGFTTGSYAVPSDEEIASVLAFVGTDMLEYDEESALLTLKEGMAIGLGGIAKGYSGDRLMEIFKEYGVTGAIASLGGNIVVYGEKPSGDLWKIAIQDPEDSSAYVCVLSLEGDVNVITSGGYERYFEEDGVTYHHIIDPDTGHPADAGLTSVSIISADGTSSDGLSTALFVMGLEEAVQFWQTNTEYDFDMVLVDESGNVYITEGLADSYSSSYDVTIISK